MHIHHRIPFVPGDQRMGRLTNDRDLGEPGIHAKELLDAVAVRTIPKADERERTGGQEIASFEGPGSAD